MKTFLIRVLPVLAPFLGIVLCVVSIFSKKLDLSLINLPLFVVYLLLGFVLAPVYARLYSSVTQDAEYLHALTRVSTTDSELEPDVERLSKVTLKMKHMLRLFFISERRRALLYMQAKALISLALMESMDRRALIEIAGQFYKLVDTMSPASLDRLFLDVPGVEDAAKRMRSARPISNMKNSDCESMLRSISS